MLQNASSAYDAALDAKNIVEFNLRFSKIYAPAHGRIIKKLAEENEFVPPGMPVLVFSEDGKDEWIVKAGVSDKDRMKINFADPANVSFDAYGDKVFNALVTRLAAIADPTTGTFEIELTIKSEDATFINGLAANVSIQTSAGHLVSLIPPDAITETDGNKGYVYVVNASNMTARKIPVTICFISQNNIAVLEPLNKIGNVITKGAAWLEDGSKIKIIKNYTVR
jgi:RND family efflux transporter MFP subunit